MNMLCPGEGLLGLQKVRLRAGESIHGRRRNPLEPSLGQIWGKPRVTSKPPPSLCPSAPNSTGCLRLRLVLCLLHPHQPRSLP